MADGPQDKSSEPGGAEGQQRAARPRGAARVSVPEPPTIGLDAVGAALLVSAPDGTVVALNGPAAKLLGVDEESIVGASLLDVRSWAGTWWTEKGEEIKPGTSLLATSAFGGQAISDQVVALRPSGSDDVTWLRISAEPLYSPTGHVEDIVVTLVDITSLKATSDALHDAVSELNELLVTLPDTYVYLDADDVVRRVAGARDPGQGVPRGFTRRGVGETLWASLSEDAAARMRKAAAMARATGRPVTTEIATVTPTAILHDEVRHIPRDDEGLLLIVRDVTESRRAAEALRRSEEKYRTLYLRTPVMLHSIDAEGRLLSVSDRWLQRLGYTAGEVLGRYATEFLTEEAHRKEVADGLPCFGPGACADVPYQMVAKDGSVVDVLLSSTSEHDSSGGVLRSLAVVVDVTEQRRAVRELAERDRVLQNLLANVPGMAYRCAGAPEWTMQVLSDGCVPLTGYTADELLAPGEPTFGELIETADLEAARREIRAALERGEPWTVTYRIATRSGETRWAWERGIGVRSDDGDVAYLEGFVSDITELRAAEQALSDREQMLSGLVGSLPGAAYRSELRDPWHTTFLSEGFRRLLGRDPGDLVAGSVRWADAVHPDDLDRLADDLDRDLAIDSPTTESEYRILTADGQVRWVLDRAVFVHDEDGTARELIGLLIDVTDLHQALDAQAESERRLRTTIDNVPGMVYRSQAVAPWSDEFIAGGDVSVTGYSAEELTDPAFRWSDIMHPEDIHLLAEASAAAVEEGSAATEYRIVTKQGEERWLLDRFILLRDREGRPVQEGIMLDVTARVEAERALRESEQRYRALYEGSPVGVFLFDTELRFVDCNSAFEEIFGRPAADYSGAHIPSLSARLEFLQPMQDAVDGKEGVYEGPYQASSGRPLWITLTVAPRYDADGRIIGATGVVLDRTQQKHTEERMEHLLLHDPVTGLANRSLLEDRVGQALKHASRKRLAFALAAFRVDRFDTVESSLGRGLIEQLLEELGRRFQRAGRAEDTVAHLGGGQFAALLPGAAGPSEATAAVNSLLSAVAEPLTIGEHELFLTLSLGVSIFPTDGSTTAELLRCADTAMRQASDSGGDRWQFFHPGLNEEQADRLKLDAELHRALSNEQFFLEYQPLVDAASEAVIGVEALVRWRHPERGVIPPLEFIPVAEDTGILARIGEWILTQACTQGRAWQRELGRPLRMAVNISARQLHDETLVDTVRRTLRATGFDPHALELEITETAAMRDARHTAQILGALRAMGVRVALDDFGTGYSSLSHLVRLPISTVKIDRSFVRDLLDVPEHAAVAASVIALGHRLGLTVVAEGVETVAERRALRDEGCDAIQGFLYSRALPADECLELLRAGFIRR